jgi:DNA (cytosine-5)-methyltransferase 1
MNYINHLNRILKPKTVQYPLVLDLFAGCGGLSLGFEAQGFATIGYEKEASPCATYNHNLTGECLQIELTTKTKFPPVEIVIGSPPCQPFSVGGKQKGSQDKRDGFPIFIKAIEIIKPEIWLFENVRGLLYKNFNYFTKIINHLESLGYIIEWKILNAVNFDVPQNRERLIVVGHRGKYQFPAIKAKIITSGEALGELAYQSPLESKFLTPNMDQYIANYEKASACINPRDLNLNKPARTLTCRNLSAATGDMQRILLPDGRRRRLLLKEASRLQSFPDWFEFIGTETNCFNQIGNAVPPLFAYHLANSIKNYILSQERLSIQEIQRKAQPFQLSLPINI